MKLGQKPVLHVQAFLSQLATNLQHSALDVGPKLSFKAMPHLMQYSSLSWMFPEQKKPKPGFGSDTQYKLDSHFR